MFNFQDFIEIHKKAITLKSSQNYKQQLTKDEMQEKIKELVKGEDFLREDILKLLERFHIQYKNSKSVKYLEIYKNIKYLFNYFQHEDGYTGNKDNIIEAYIYSLKSIEGDNNIVGLEPSTEDKIECLFQSILYFRKAGFKININNGEIVFNEAPKIAKIIDSKMDLLGIWGVEKVVKRFRKWEKSEIYKYIDASKNIIEPIGYIFKKSLKHLNSPKVSLENCEKIFKEVLELSSHYISIYGVQKYSYAQFEYIYSSPKSMIDLLSKQALADQVFKVEQYDSESIFSFISYVRKQYDYKEIEYLYEISKNILECNNNIPVLVNKKLDDLDRKYHNNLEFKVKDLLVNKNVNLDFVTIHDFGNLNFLEKPFLSNEEGNIFFLNHNFFYVGFYNVLFKILYLKKQDKKQGELIERFAESQLHKTNDLFIEGEKKYKVSKTLRGKLNIPSHELESDMIVYNDNSIAFFEIKLRELVKKSKAGNPYSILEDLTQSLVRSQTQLNKHMRFLVENKEIKFNSDKYLKYNNQKIFKVSVSSLDYMGLSSRLVYINFLKLIVTFRLVVDSKFKKEIDFINKHFDEFTNEIKNNNKDEDILIGHAFRNTAYLNVFQLIFLIHRSSLKKVSLIDEIMETRAFFPDQTDFYYYYKFFD
ncbi:hypothetical protein LH685_14890 [Acinetobacter nosocomialis]|uniref:hypothetical protein n=1 Tax=Acinetobacter nosocomialis TaxID=106654 RepID=UPI001F2213F9|nr:hypothetical protein [Acinetobacter nosocomialis]MCF1297065.1 hypothetical protein [Acinetobacter nosocomialis]